MGDRIIRWHKNELKALGQPPCRFSFRAEVTTILRTLPQGGPLLPHLTTLRAADRATKFRKRGRTVGIEAVTLHSYRYARAERARAVGYPERFALQALGYNSKAGHHAYAKRAEVTRRPLEEYKTKQELPGKVIRLTSSKP